MIIIILALLVHWIADFVLQTHWQAINKSSRWRALLGHTVLYTSIMFWAWAMLLSYLSPEGVRPIDHFSYATLFLFPVITFVAHTVTDYFTSRVVKQLFAENNPHDAFVVIGFDQILHYVQLLLTYELLI